MPDAATLKAYIEKHNLEDVLSNAVNLAIQQDSDDPCWVMSEYLKTLCTHVDDECEDDEDVIPEGQEIPVMKARGRRDQVMAASIEAPDDWTPPVYDKSEADMAWLKNVVSTNPLMKNLAPSDRSMLEKAFKETEFKEGDQIIKQGDPGDLFYIIKTGTPPSTACAPRPHSPPRSRAPPSPCRPGRHWRGLRQQRRCESTSPSHPL